MAMLLNQTLQRTVAALLVDLGALSLSAAAAAELSRQTSVEACRCVRHKASRWTSKSLAR